MSELDLEWTGFPMEEAATLVAGRHQWVLLPPAQAVPPVRLPEISLFPSDEDVTAHSGPNTETERPPRRA